MRRTEESVRALGEAQQSLLSLGRAIGQRQQAASDERAQTYAYHLFNNPSAVAPESLYSQRTFTFPLAGTVVYAKQGEPIVMASEGFFAPCFIALDNGEASSIGGHHHHVRAGELVCKLKARDSAYTPLYNNYSFSGGEMSMGQTLELKNGAYKICYRNMGMNAMCVKDIPRDRVVETIGIVELKKTSHEVATFEGERENKLVFAMKNVSLSDNPLRKFDVSFSKSLEIADIHFDVLESGEQSVVLRRK